MTKRSDYSNRVNRESWRQDGRQLRGLPRYFGICYLDSKVGKPASAELQSCRFCFQRHDCSEMKPPSLADCMK